MKEIKITLVDDDEDDYLLFLNILDYKKYNRSLYRVVDVDELMNHLENRKHELPQIIFLDMKLPKKSGLDILKMLKADERFYKILIAIYSASYDKRIAQALYEMEANFYIKKPISFKNMKRLIEYALGIISNQEDKYYRSEDNYLIT